MVRHKLHLLCLSQMLLMHGHQQVDYQCCRADMSGCSTQEVSLEACVSEDVLSALADQVCADLGQAVSSSEPTQACGTDTYQAVEVTCCVIDPS